MRLEDILQARSGVIEASFVQQGELTLWLERAGLLSLVIIGDALFDGEPTEILGQSARIGALTSANAQRLASHLPWLSPVPLGKRLSFGFGDRLGNATSGHVAALRQADPAGRFAPIFAQQSVRENTRIGRTPQEVMDAARWGVLQTGWRSDWGADADHIKAVADIAAFVSAGYTFYTIDPSDHVDNAAQTDAAATLQDKVAALPWDKLASTYDAFKRRYVRRHDLDGVVLEPTEVELLRALAKYGRALAFTLELAQAISRQLGGKPFDLEMSIDETDTPTSALEHYLIASELLRRGVPLVSLAPRFVGKFQKGVDYIGDVAQFARELRAHSAIVQHFDCYKLSVHTGSDKFSLYPVIAEQLGELVHVKTAGTSYLEALRVIARFEPTLFRELLEFARSKFDTDKKSYFLDCRPENVPAAAQLDDADLPGLLEQFDARQLLHVTFGSVIDRYRDTLMTTLSTHDAAYTEGLKQHFVRHLAPFTGGIS
jgi:hypothetical protein